MILSDEQSRAAHHGMGREPTFEWVDLPVGPQPLPAWARGLHVDFMIGYGNAPHYTVKTAGRVMDWAGKVFTKEGSRYMATTDDGRAAIFYHNGPVSMQPVRRFMAADGILKQYARTVGDWDSENHGREPGEWVDVQKLCTTQQQGFGGSHVECQMDDGTEVVLRGPWHGQSPPGWMDVGTTHGGLYISEDLFKRLLARFHPEMRCARVTDNIGSHLEAVDGMWDVPKAWLPAEPKLIWKSDE